MADWCARLVLFTFWLGSSGCHVERWSRDLDCHLLRTPREVQICRAFEPELEWTRQAYHGVYKPGYRCTPQTIRRVFCAAQLTPADQPLLKDMMHGSGRISFCSELMHGAIDGLRKPIEARSPDWALTPCE